MQMIKAMNEIRTSTGHRDCCGETIYIGDEIALGHKVSDETHDAEGLRRFNEYKQKTNNP